MNIHCAPCYTEEDHTEELMLPENDNEAIGGSMQGDCVKTEPLVLDCKTEPYMGQEHTTVARDGGNIKLEPLTSLPQHSTPETSNQPHHPPQQSTDVVTNGKQHQCNICHKILFIKTHP